MQRRGFIAGWKNRRWQNDFNAYAGGQNIPNVPPGGTGVLPDYLTFTPLGTGRDYYYDSDDDRIYYDSEKIFISPPFMTYDGHVFRFAVLYTRSSRWTQNCTFYFCIVFCNGNGTVTEAGYGRAEWSSGLGSYGSTAKALLLSTGAASEKWNKIISEIPYLRNDAYNMMMNRAAQFYADVTKIATTGHISTELLSISTTPAALWGGEPLYWLTPSTDAAEIVARARSLSGFKYWFGGAGQVASRALADSLKQSYPNIWTSTYYQKALKDIGQQVGDCSYLVNYAYGRASPGNHGPGTSNYLAYYSKWTGSPKDGMIAWRNGHTGIYAGGKTLELVGIDYDYQEKPYNPAKWAAILYDPNRSY